MYNKLNHKKISIRNIYTITKKIRNFAVIRTNAKTHFVLELEFR